MKKIEEYVKSIPDFPEKGIIFRDVTSVLQDADGLHLAIDEMQKFLEDVEFDVISDGAFLEKGTLVEIYKISNSSLVVRKARQE